MTSPEQEPSQPSRLTRLFGIFSRYVLYLVGALILVFCILQYVRVKWYWQGWDFMLLSGLVVFLIALFLARSVPYRMEQTINRLVNRGAFKMSPKELVSFQTQMSKRGKNFGVVFAVIVGIAIFIAFVLAQHTFEIGLLILETFLGLVAGFYIGQMIAYGTMGQLARTENVNIVSQPGHIDGAAGLQPIGNYYFFQAKVVALPCAFLAVWWVIIPLTPWYSNWREPYLLLLIVALIFEIFSFIAPMWVFHLIMSAAKMEHLENADEISQKVMKLESQIIETTDSNWAGELQDQSNFLRERYREIENMPTWPVDANTRRRFTFNNLALFSPFLLDIVSSSGPWRKFLDLVVDFLAEDM